MHIDTMKVKITGITPLLLCNGQLANPFNPFSKRMKRISAKKTKTEDDLRELLSIQWEGGLYWDEELGLYYPSESIFAAFHCAAKKFKLGSKCSGVSVPEPIGYPIKTPNAKDIIKLREDPTNKFEKMVNIQKNKVLSSRPIFKTWAIDFELEFEKEMINPDEMKMILLSMGQRVGFGNWRPSSPKPGTFGRFKIDQLQWIDSKSGKEKLIAA